MAAEKLHAYLLRYPGSTGVVGRKDKTAAHRSVVPFLQYKVMGNTSWGEYKKSEGLFQYNNGSQLWVVGLRDEGQRENLRSIGRDGSFDVAWLEEANKLTLNDHQELITRMRGINGGFNQLMYTTNPDYPEHWIKKLLIDKKQASTYYSRPEDNPANPPEYLLALQGLTGVFRQRMWEGLWVQAEGAIYSEYDSNIHLLDRRIITPHDGRYIVTVDFGFTNPFSCTLWRVTADGIMLQVKQIYFTRKLVEDHAVKIREMILGCGIPLPRIEAWVCDHDAEDRATLERHLGIKTIAAYKAISTGIEAVKTRLKNKRLFLNLNAVDNVDPELEKLYLPTCTADEVPAYSWSDKKAETPIGEHDHGCDEMRYAVAYVDRIDKKRIKVNSGTQVQNYISTVQVSQRRV